jgi:hypothetical protein
LALSRAIAHGSLRSPAKRLGAATPRAGCVPGPRRQQPEKPGLADNARVPGEAQARSGLRRRAPERLPIDARAFEERH